MSEIDIQKNLLSVVKYPIFRIDKHGVILECHIHKDFNALPFTGNLVGRNINEFDYLPNGVDVIKFCLDNQKSEVTYFSVPEREGDGRYFEVEIEPSSASEVIALVKEITNRKKREAELIQYYNLIQDIYQGTASSTGHAFLDHLTRQFCKAFNGDYSFIALFENEGLSAVSFSTYNKMLENETFDIAGSPFEHLHHQEILSIPADCQLVYPTFEPFKKYDVQGFIGIPLFYPDHQDKPAGVMCVLFQKYYHTFQHYEKILRIFSTRAITELDRIRRTKQLEESEEKFKALYHNTPALFNSVDAEGHIIEAGDYFLETTGYTREEVIGKMAFDLLTPESKSYGMTKVFPEYVKTGYCKDVPFQFVKKNGEVMDVLFSSVVVKDNQGNFEKSLTSLQDVTEINKRRREIIRSESRVSDDAQRLQSLFDHSPVGIIIHSKGIIKKINAEAVRLTKAKSAKQILGKSPMDFIHPDSHEVASQRIHNIYTKKTAHKNEQKFICMDGSIIWVEAMGTLISFEGEPAVQIAIYDITDRKLAQEKILENEKNLKHLNNHLTRQNHQLEEFAHIASHNLRAPITNMMSLIQIKESDQDAATELFVWENLKKGVANLDETIVELNEVVKSSWELDKRKRKVRLSSALNKILASIKNELLESEGEIESDFTAFDEITYPKVYIESILINLITNGLKYADPKRKLIIQVKTTLHDGMKRLEVKDNGLGIDINKYGSKIFGLRKTFHNHPDARGVGLFITKAQVESMGGTIRVESEMGKGSNFIINFGEG
ncbi:PAS domain S-box-containing protein [Reichenbachiella faecimaris]|uniref:histidine kinase n=1 Tax=Reichenbachiella faecimaris TaxID=692418 RepID=A0A1W2GHX7_REIFA|nr:PAS domain S-box protein [Reichenbachiella faecimaris]SMD36263.1 PAS domain S-box-containing protein [Reichenbachiella faecimaris]